MRKYEAIASPPLETRMEWGKVYGFGYDSESDDYKIFRVSRYVNVMIQDLTMGQKQAWVKKKWTKAQVHLESKSNSLVYQQ